MKVLEKINLLYGKFLYVLTPVITVAIALMEIFSGSCDALHIMAYITMGFVSISFCGFYLMSERRNIVYCLIELYMLYYVAFLAIANHVLVSDSIWYIFICTAIFGLFFILFFKRFYDKKTT